MTKNKYLIETVVDSIESALIAEKFGADRLELCASMHDEGLSPAIGIIKSIIEEVSIPLYVMVRPRSGTFYYSEREYRAMEHEVRVLKDWGVAGFVVGGLTGQRGVDVELIKVLRKAGEGMNFTFHRAFDFVREPEEALKILSEEGVDRLLTSGQTASAEMGMRKMAKWIEMSPDLIIIPAGGILPSNVATILSVTGAKECHLSARMPYFNWEGAQEPRELPIPAMGQYEKRSIVDGNALLQVREILDHLS